MRLELEVNPKSKIEIELDSEYLMTYPLLGKNGLYILSDLYPLYEKQMSKGLELEAEVTYNKMKNCFMQTFHLDNEPELTFNYQETLFIKVNTPILFTFNVPLSLDSEQRNVLELYSKKSKKELLITFAYEFKIECVKDTNCTFLSNLQELSEGKFRAIKDQDFEKANELQGSIKKLFLERSPYENCIPVYFSSGIDWYVVNFEV